MKLALWLITAFSVGAFVGPFLILPFVPKEHRKEALKIILRPWRKPPRMFPDDGKNS